MSDISVGGLGRQVGGPQRCRSDPCPTTMTLVWLLVGWLTAREKGVILRGLGWASAW